MRAAGFLALMAAMALAAWLGWWTLPAVGLLWGLLRPGVAHPVLWASVAAVGAWGFWLGVNLIAGQGGLGRIGERLAAILGVPLPGLLAGTLLLAALLAGSAAAVGYQMAGWMRRPPARPPI